LLKLAVSVKCYRAVVSAVGDTQKNLSCASNFFTTLQTVLPY